MFSIANQGSTDPRELSEAKGIIRFAVEMCELQIRAGRHFVVEQPLTSRAWTFDTAMKLATMEDVITMEFHQCMYGIEAVYHFGSAPAYKPTRILTSQPTLVEALTRRCDGSHRHAQLVGKSACARAAQYPHGLCKSILDATAIVRKHRDEQRAYVLEVEGIQEGGCGVPLAARQAYVTEARESLRSAELEDMCQEDEDWKWQEEEPYDWNAAENTTGVVCDTTTGKVLDPKKVQSGRQEELDWMQKMHVWDRVPRSEATRKGDGK